MLSERAQPLQGDSHEATPENYEGEGETAPLMGPVRERGAILAERPSAKRESRHGFRCVNGLMTRSWRCVAAAVAGGFGRAVFLRARVATRA
ncbi:hypothetical protein LA76x_3172 [Lysobacter antibioticus]|uniref:Uncharacterized protein n=1 Tax=Lysobacter antibioticus TaxID=84531 RepID=A0A0S2FCR4_LYSAN|nr:hypothetical protein LA76x_3172 [Lysobacter antibioticus]